MSTQRYRNVENSRERERHVFIFPHTHTDRPEILDALPLRELILPLPPIEERSPEEEMGAIAADVTAGLNVCGCCCCNCCGANEARVLTAPEARGPRVVLFEELIRVVLL